MVYEIDWTEPALADLRRISDYLAEHNPTAAEKVVDEILERAELLRTTPRMGAVLGRDNRGSKRQIIVRKYRIIYRINDNARRVEILTVWHGSRQDPVVPD